MFRKWMSIFLAVLMLALAPASVLADTQHTLTIIPGDEMPVEPAIADLLNVMALRLTTGENASALSVLLQDQAVVSLALNADMNGMYAESKILGEDVLFITWEDTFDILSMAMEMALQESGMYDEDMAQMLTTFMDEFEQSFYASIESVEVVEAEPAVPATVEVSPEMFAEAFGYDSEMAAISMEIYEQRIVEEGVFTAANRDDADLKTVLTMTSEHFVRMMDTQYMRNYLAEALAAEYPEMTQEDLDMVMAEAKKLIENGECLIVVEFYTANEGAVLVGLDMDMNIAMKENANSQTALVAFEMAGGYNRLTDAEGVSHKADLTLEAEGEEIEFAFETYQQNNDADKGMFGMLIDGEEVVITYKAENLDEDTRVRQFDLYLRSGATAVIEPAASDRPIIGVAIVTEPADEELLAKIESATPENSVNIIHLSEAELMELGNTITVNATQALFSAMSLLPTSTLNMLMAE